MAEAKKEDWRRLHESAVIVDMHSDIPADVVKRRGQGEKAGVFGRIHAQGWREGGMDGAVVTVAGCILGASLWPITSTFAFSGICQKLGDWRLGSVCMFNISKTDATPCEGYWEELSAI